MNTPNYRYRIVCKRHAAHSLYSPSIQRSFPNSVPDAESSSHRLHSFQAFRNPTIPNRMCFPYEQNLGIPRHSWREHTTNNINLSGRESIQCIQVVLDTIVPVGELTTGHPQRRWSRSSLQSLLELYPAQEGRHFLPFLAMGDRFRTSNQLEIR